MVSTDYNITRADASKINEIYLLHNLCFRGNSPAKKDFIKKYDTSCFGSEFIGYLAYHKQSNELVAYYGVFPVIVNHFGTPILAAQSGDTMTHPEHSKKGLFTYLAKKTYETAKDSGVKFIFGVPNNNSLRGLVKLGFLSLGPIIIHKQIIQPHFFPRVIRKFSKSIYSKYASTLLDKLKTDKLDIFTSFSNLLFEVQQSKNYIKYKITKDLMFLELNSAYVALKFDMYSIFIGKYYLKENHDQKDFWREMNLIGEKLSVHSISYHTSSFVPNPENKPSYLNIQSSMPLLVLSLNTELNDFSEFYLTGFDYDTF